MNLIKELEEAGFFKFVEDENHLQFIIQTMNTKLQNEKMIYFPDQSYYQRIALKTGWNGLGNSIEFRSCSVDAEGMLRGNFVNELKRIKELFEKRCLKFDIGVECLDWKQENSSHIKHEIEINNKKYTIADGAFDRGAGSIHYLLQVEKIITEQLLLQSSTERVHKIVSYYGEMVWYVIMEDKHFQIFEENKNEFNASQLIKDSIVNNYTSQSSLK